MITGEELCQLARSLPGVEEREVWGEPTFRVGYEIFFMLSPSVQQAAVKASLAEQAALVALEPGTFTIARYSGRFGYITVQLAIVDPILMSELLIKAWRKIAPPLLVAKYDAQQMSPQK